MTELLLTEREFCRDLKLTWQAFGLDTPEVLEQRQVDVQGLFGNLSDVIEISTKFLETLSDCQGTNLVYANTNCNLEFHEI